MNSPMTPITKVASSAEELGQQIEALREELVKLAANATEDVSRGLGRAGRQIGQTSRDARATATNAVLGHPLTAVGIAAGIGFMLGMMVRKG